MLFRKTLPSGDTMISNRDGSRSIHSPDIIHIQCSIFQYPYIYNIGLGKVSERFRVRPLKPGLSPQLASHLES